MTDRRTGSLSAVAVTIVCQLVATLGCSTGDELEHIKAADAAYAVAWLANDSEQVMATLAADAVIVPSGMIAIQGEEAIRRFWWPENSPSTQVTEFTLIQHEIGQDGATGFVRGSFMLAFEYDGREYSSAGEYLSLLRCDRAGSWKISHRMWSDRPPDK
jgi:ketosteroid isomerase-like protein